MSWLDKHSQPAHLKFTLNFQPSAALFLNFLEMISEHPSFTLVDTGVFCISMLGVGSVFEGLKVRMTPLTMYVWRKKKA